MDDATPYRTRPAGERQREMNCFTRILADAADVDLVLETFGGMGDTTTVVRQRWPGAEIWATELDPETHAAHTQRFQDDPRTHCVLEDVLKNDWARGLVDRYGIIVDFNLMTIKRLRDASGFVQQVLAVLPLSGARWVTVTDAAISKLQINKRYYGPSIETVDDYRSALVEELQGVLPGDWVLGAHANHSRAMYLRMDNHGT